MSPTFLGFNTIGQEKKFSLTDFELIKRDILNSFLIRSGEVPGRPGYGTTIHNLIFENLTPDIIEAVEVEIRRVLGQEPRVAVLSIALFTSDHIVVAEVNIETLPDRSAKRLFLRFDANSQSISIV